MRRGLAIALPLLILAGGAQAEDVGRWPSASLLARQFERIAFSSEFSGESRRGRLIRWEGPIRIRLTGDVSETARIEVERQIAELRQLSGLSIELAVGTAEGASPAMVVEFSHSRGGTSFDPAAPCRTLIWEEQFVIRRAHIYIAPEPGTLRRHCIAEELTQALGLADDSNLLRDSIYSDGSNRERIAPWDALMVRVLYDRRLWPGMRRREAMPVVRRIIAEYFGSRGATTSSPPR